MWYIYTMTSLRELAIRMRPKYTRNVCLEFVCTGLFACLGGAVLGDFAPWGNGLALTALIFMSDGGHLSPCVSLSAVLANYMSPLLGLLYVTAQVGGAIVGVYWQSVLLPKSVASMGCFVPNDVNLLQVLAWESTCTFVIVVVVHAVALRFNSFSNVEVPLRPETFGHAGPIAVGFSLAASAMACGRFTGASLNIARTIAPAVVYRCMPAKHVLIYCGGELIGTVLGACVSMLAFGRPKRTGYMRGGVVQMRV